MPRSSQTASTIGAYGAIEGRIERAASPDPRRFTLLPAFGSEPIACTLGVRAPTVPDDLWVRRATVEGWVRRDGETGVPLAIDDVSTVTPLPEVEPGSIIRSLRGIAPAPPGAPHPEEIIRRLRDEW